MEKILNVLKQALGQDTFVRMILSAPRKKTLPCRKITIRPVQLQQKIRFQWEFHFETKVTQENMTLEGTLQLLPEQIRVAFKQINILMERATIQILASKPEHPRIIRRNAGHAPASMQHNRIKARLIPEGTPCDFLIRLGVMKADGTIIPKHYSKFRQINRYLEIVDDIYDHLPHRHLKIIDFGCGKAYLTFALYHYMNRIKKRDVSIIGLDLKQDVIQFCRRTAADLDWHDLLFDIGDIATYEDTGADMVVTLHACDTATDFALIHAVHWNASVILSVPCCQHELFSQIRDPLLDPILRHGIIKDRFTEILTDGIRALKLESKGYDVSMIEFTSLEHTARNIMIKAVRNQQKKQKERQKAQSRYEALCAQYHLHPTIDAL